MSTLLPPEHAKAMAAFDHVQRTRLVFGNGSAGRVGALSAELGLRRILLVTDPGIVRAGHAAIVQEALESAGLEVVLFDAVIRLPLQPLVVLRGKLLHRRVPQPWRGNVPGRSELPHPGHPNQCGSLSALRGRGRISALGWVPRS